jgi:hypothetical protein
MNDIHEPAFAAGLRLGDDSAAKLRFLAECAHFMTGTRRLDAARALYKAFALLRPESGFVDVELAKIAWIEGRSEETLRHAEAAETRGTLNAGELALALGLQGAARGRLLSRDATDAERRAVDELFARARRVGAGTYGGAAAEELARCEIERNGAA